MPVAPFLRLSPNPDGGRPPRGWTKRIVTRLCTAPCCALPLVRQWIPPLVVGPGPEGGLRARPYEAATAELQASAHRQRDDAASAGPPSHQDLGGESARDRNMQPVEAAS